MHGPLRAKQSSHSATAWPSTASTVARWLGPALGAIRHRILGLGLGSTTWRLRRHVIYRVGVTRHWPTKVRLRSGRPGRCFRSCRVSRQVCFDTRGTGGGWPSLRLVIGSFRGDRHQAIAPARMELSAIGPPRRPTLYFTPGHWGPVYRARHARCTHRLPHSFRSACTARRTPAVTRAVSHPGTGTAQTPDALRSVSAIHPVPSTVGAAQSCSGDQPSCARPADLHAPCPSI